MQIYQGIEDPSLPLFPKECLQQYDNYQIYDLYCLDRVIEIDNYEWRVRIFTAYQSYSSFLVKFRSSGTETLFGTQLLAVQKYSPVLISFDFDRLINRYIDIPVLPTYTTCRYGTNRTDGGSPIDPSLPPAHYQTLAFSGSNIETATTNYYRWTVSQTGLPTSDSPNFFNLVNGYELDTRIKSKYIRFVAPKTESISVSYFRSNPFEPIPNLTSVDWCIFDMDIKKGETYFIDIDNIIFGTLSISSILVTQLISESTTLFNQYPFSVYLVDGDISLFAEWVNKYTQMINSLPASPDFPSELNSIETSFGDYGDFLYQPFYANPIIFERSTYVVNPSILRKISANNNIWANNFSDSPDVNFQSNHPLFRVREQRAYNWHIKPQSDGSFGDLIMNSPEIKEIHAALNAKKWATNLDDLTKTRKDDLGWRIQRICELLGIRVGTDGKFDPVKEKKIVRQVIPAKQKLDPEKIGINNFGDGGMVVKRINNRFDGDKIESDQCVIIHDLLQLIQEHHEQHNLAIGLQESSAIEIKDPKDEKGNNKARFDNQLGLLLEIFNLLSSANEMTRANLISSLITQSQTSEVIAGLGLPSVTKTIPIEIDKKVTQLPYKGIAPHRSISQEVATCTANVGIVLGQLL